MTRDVIVICTKKIYILKMDYCIVISTCLAVFLYLNTLKAGFAYDDSRAILKNPDLPPSSPISNLFYNDFWGTPLTHSGSHKSYRPLCVLTFRLNYFLGELNPWGYHMGNVVFHAITTAVFTYFSKVLVQTQLATLSSGLLFASHPIHTEAVAGIVGRADVMACLFFLLTLLCYMDYVKKRESARSSSRWLPAFALMILAAAGMLSKEHALTALGVCGVFDVFIWHRARIKDVLTLKILTEKRFRGMLEGLTILAVSSISLLAFRICFMGNKPPEFAPSDNPASDSEHFQTRLQTYLYLPCANFWMLLCPRVLSFDWSMEAVPLLDDLFDPRNFVSFIFYSTLGVALFLIGKALNENSGSLANILCFHNSGQQKSNSVNGVKAYSNHHHHHHHHYQQQQHLYSQKDAKNNNNNNNNISQKQNYGNINISSNNNSGKAKHDDVIDSHSNNNNNCIDVTSVHYQPIDVITMAIAIVVFPFLPATNLLFYVGFVIAERILYTPSMGVCLLVGLGMEALYRRMDSEAKRKAVLVGFGALLVSYSVKTVARNKDWQTEERLYSSGVAVNPAKAWGNLANIYNDQNRTIDAEKAYRNALTHRSNMADVHYNLGILLQNQRRFQEATESYTNAISFRPKLTVAYLNLGILSAQLGNKEKAKDMYIRCADMDTAGLKDPRLHDSAKISCMFNHGRLLMDGSQNQEALDLFNKALSRRPDYYAPQSLYNMIGETYFKMQNIVEAEKWYLKSLEAKPDHIPAHLTMAKLYQAKDDYEETEKWFAKAKKINSQDITVDFHRAQFLETTNRGTEAMAVFNEILPKVGDDFDVIYNAAHTYREHGKNQVAEGLYVKAANLRPKDAVVHMNLGAIFHMNSKLKEAEQSYLTALRIEPDSQVTLQNLQKLRNLMAKTKS